MIERRISELEGQVKALSNLLVPLLLGRKVSADIGRGRYRNGTVVGHGRHSGAVTVSFPDSDMVHDLIKLTDCELEPCFVG